MSAPVLQRRTIPLRLALLLAASCLTACEVGPNYVRPAVETPPAFKEVAGWTPATPADTLDRGDWWTIFNDPILNGLESKVAISNQNLAASEAAYRQAKAVVDADRASLFPTVNLSGSATRSHNGGGALGGGGLTASSYQVSLGASWAPDVWGRIRRTIEGAKASAQASAADLANARLSAQSTLAADYLQLRLADADKVLLQTTADGYATALKITRNQYNAGVAAKSDVLQAETQLTNVQASIVDLDTQRAQAEHAIAVLIGEPPADLTIQPDPKWGPKPPATPIEVPSTLLQRRPDIAAAERGAASANAQIGVQVAGYFPDINLTGSYGFASNALGALFNSSNSLWSLGASATQLVFDAGATSARVRGAKAARDEAVAQYRQTVLTAFQQVEDNLAAARVLQVEEPLRLQASQEANEAEQISLNQYKAGTVAYTTVVTTEATALSARQTLLTLQVQRITTAISLIEALGGGWSAKQLPG